MPNPYLLPNPYFRLRFTPNVVQTLTIEDVLDSLSGDSKVSAQFETGFARYVSAQKAIGFSSGRASLQFALTVLTKESNFEVIIPTFVCGAVADAIISAGGTPVLCDVKGSDGTLDPSKIKSCVTSRTRGIVVVHYQGLPADIDEIQEIGEALDIPIIEDCAHSIGSTFRNKPLGSFGSFAFYSFSVDKPMTTGNGGALTTSQSGILDDASLTSNLKIPSRGQEIHVLRLLLETDMLANARTYGFSSFTYFPAINFSQAAFGLKPRYDVSRITQIASKMGLLRLRDLNRVIEARKRKSASLSEALQNCKKIQLIESISEKKPVFLRYTILAQTSSSRERLMRELKRSGIEGGPINWRRALHMFPYYLDICKTRTPLNGADEFSSRFLNLPCHPFVTESDISKIAECVGTL